MEKEKAPAAMKKPTKRAPRVRTRERREKRNARERENEQLKKRKMEEMREEVAQLEEKKQRLEDTAWVSSLPLEDEDALTSKTTTSAIENPAQERCLRALQHAAGLRKENHALADELNRRELVSNAVQRLVDRVGPPDQKEMERNPFAYRVDESDARQLVDAMYTHLCGTHERIGTADMFTKIELFGWSDLRCVVGDFVDFAVKKSFAEQSAIALWRQAWGFFTNLKTVGQMVTPMVFRGRGRYRQNIGDSIAIIYGVGGGMEGAVEEDTSRPCNDFLLARAEKDGKGIIFMGYFDAANIKAHLNSPKPLTESFSWYYEDVPANAAHGPQTLVQVAGSVANVTDAEVRSMICEHVFVVIRWETMAIRQRRLVWGNEEETNESEATEDGALLAIDASMLQSPSAAHTSDEGSPILEDLLSI